jgi:two-component system response regulator MprA
MSPIRQPVLTKPFAFAELVARLHALLRRAGASGAVEVAGIRLDPVTHAVSGDGVELPLTPTEFRLLARLLSRPGERCAGASSCGRVARRRDVRENTLDALRRPSTPKLKGIEGSPEIVTVHGVGYRLG